MLNQPAFGRNLTYAPYLWDPDGPDPLPYLTLAAFAEREHGHGVRGLLIVILRVAKRRQINVVQINHERVKGSGVGQRCGLDVALRGRLAQLLNLRDEGFALLDLLDLLSGGWAVLSPLLRKALPSRYMEVFMSSHLLLNFSSTKQPSPPPLHCRFARDCCVWMESAKKLLSCAARSSPCLMVDFVFQVFEPPWSPRPKAPPF